MQSEVGPAARRDLGYLMAPDASRCPAPSAAALTGARSEAPRAGFVARLPEAWVVTPAAAVAELAATVAAAVIAPGSGRVVGVAHHVSSRACCVPHELLVNRRNDQAVAMSSDILVRK